MNTDLNKMVKAQLIELVVKQAEEIVALRAANSSLKVQLQMADEATNEALEGRAAPKVKAPAPKSRVLRVKEHVYATAEEFKVGLARVTEWAKTHEARISTSGLKIYVKTPA